MSLVGEHLERRGVVFEALTHARTYSTLDEARALGIAADAVLKTVVLRTAAGYALAVVPANRRLNMRLTRRATGDSHVRLSTEDELQRHFPGFELGAVPPLGSLLGVHVFVDPEVMDHDRVVFAAGSQTESVLVRTEDLFAEEDPTVVVLGSREEDVLGEPAPAPPAAKPAARRPARKRTTTKRPPKRAAAKRKVTRVAKKRVAKGASVKTVDKTRAKRTVKKRAGKKPTKKRTVKKPATKRTAKPARKKSKGQTKRTATRAAKATKRTRGR
jgi:Ala-tRNA(Pro) deacylase